MHRSKKDPLFDNFVGDLLQMHRHVEAERLGGLEVDDKLIFRWRLHRHIGWLLALENAVDVACRTPEHVDPIRSVGEQPASGDKTAIEVDRGQLVSRGQRDDQIAMNQGWSARGYDQTRTG